MRIQKNRINLKNTLAITNEGKNEENIDQNQSIRYRIRRKGQPTIFVSFIILIIFIFKYTSAR